MLGIQTYTFLIGTKVPFSDCPEIVQRFLKEQGLHYRRFLYYFEDDFGGLPKIKKDCPNIGPIRLRPTNTGKSAYLSNIDEGPGCTEAEIMAVVPKIHRRYGLSEAYILYQDVDFFNKNIPAIIRTPAITPQCIQGPGITLYRDSVFPRWNSIDLRIVIYDGTDTYDPSPYCDAMQQLLPGVRHKSFVKCCMTEEDLAIYDKLNEQATLLVKGCRRYFETHLPSSSQEGRSEVPKLTVAPVLKKLCKRFGYSYVLHENGCFFVQKRTEHGHYIVLDVDVGPMFKGVTLSIFYVGAGFEHFVGKAFLYPQGQEDLESYLLQGFQTLATAEKELFPALGDLYPPIPDWFVPHGS